MFIIGTAGHIDHGKTTLCGALTGIKTDRLREEQERGISIELGFAYADIAGVRCGIIDVPGHEKFVRQMIAGATGIDLVVLVVAADEGVMPQTREHLDICRLLGVRRGLVVLSKVDLVDEEWLELVESDVEDFVAGTFMEGAPVVHFSAVDKTTWEPTTEAIGREVDALKELGLVKDDEPLRLPVDRAFSVKGFGTVITGTVCSGKLNEGDNVVLLPTEEKSKVRGLQSHGDAIKTVRTGQRAAVNLLNLDLDSVSRGDVVTRQGELRGSRMLDIDFELLSHVPEPLQSHAKALVHVGTAQAVGTIVLLDRKELEPGQIAPAQLRLDRYVVALGSDHVVLRGFEALSTHGKTLGGGQIRHPLPRKHKAQRPEVLEALSALRGESLAAACEQVVRVEAHVGVTRADLRQVLSAAPERLAELTRDLETQGRLFSWSSSGVTRFVHCDPFNELLTRGRTLLEDYHERFPHRAGMPREELSSRIRSDLHPRYFARILAAFLASDVEEVGTRLHMAGFTPQLNAELQALSDRLHKRYAGAGLEPPLPDDVRNEEVERGATAEDVDEMLDHLIQQGKLERVVKRLIFGTEHIKSLEAQVIQFLKTNGEMSTPQLKEITGTSRKFTVPLAEHLDARQITVRAGDVRKLRKT